MTNAIRLVNTRRPRKYPCSAAKYLSSAAVRYYCAARVHPEPWGFIQGINQIEHAQMQYGSWFSKTMCSTKLNLNMGSVAKEPSANEYEE